MGKIFWGYASQNPTKERPLLWKNKEREKSGLFWKIWDIKLLGIMCVPQGHRLFSVFAKALDKPDTVYSYINVVTLH